MCGIVGIINGKNDRRGNARISAYMRDAIVANSLRGFDSTGIVQQSKDKRYLVQTEKEACDGTAFLNVPGISKFINDADDTSFTFVHNRAATRGEITADNAHPFQHTNEKGEWLIGCHNGTLNGWVRNKDYLVDSDWALSEIADDGVDAFEKFDGAYTFVWYGDREGNVLNIVRNFQRPMYVAYIKGEDRMLFASEYHMITWLAHRNGLTLDPEIIDLTPHVLYQFNLDNPREFLKLNVTPYRAPDKKDVLLNNMRRIFGVAPPVKDKAEVVKEKVVIPSTAVARPAEHKNGKKGKKDKDQPKQQHYVTSDEVQIAKHLSVNGKMVDMTVLDYIEEDKELWGVAKVGKDEFSCVIRHIDKGQADVLKRATSLGARVVGVKSYTKNAAVEMALILSRKVTLSDKEASEFGSAVEKQLNEFKNRGKSDEAGTVH